ncbi:MAG: ABC transporter ATP-binding protein/permease [Patescibacteria group bacterium]|nr:ABC transporter ATP-binding protein/permease [Patescibacteria group bacterium]
MDDKTTQDKKDKLSFSDFLATLKWLFIFNFKLSPWAATSQALIRIMIDTSPLLNALIFAKLLDKIISIVSSSNSNLYDIIPLLGLLLSYNLVISGLNYVYTYVSEVMNMMSQYRVPVILARHIKYLGIQALENPDVVNKIQRARDTIGSTANDFERMIMFFSRIVALIAAFLVIVRIMPTITLLIFIATIPELISNRIHMKKDWQLWRSETENRRKANWSMASLTDATSLQEISITSSFKALSNVFTGFADRYMAGDLKISKSWNIFGFIFGSIPDIVGIFGYFVILRNLFYKLISVGDTTFQMRALDMFAGNLSGVSNNFSALYERCIRTNEVRAAFELRPLVNDGNIKLPKLDVAPCIKFENVNFKYPNSDKYVIKDLSLHIERGEKIAIVGENGAGKTTLIKLLSRFYKLTEGGIFLNEININDVEAESWNKNLGVLFQDFNTYPFMTLKENIYIGNSEEPLDMSNVERAARRANVNSFIGDYKNGYDQVLGEKFKGGVRPSTGQWQKIAIARFFYRNSPVVVFDEPTASIDAVSEAEIFGQIYDFFTGKTVIIISHRFSTVRNADKIYVLDKGQIVESGNHKELMKMKGKYYKAFNIQAKGYK